MIAPTLRFSHWLTVQYILLSFNIYFPSRKKITFKQITHTLIDYFLQQPKNPGFSNQVVRDEETHNFHRFFSFFDSLPDGVPSPNSTFSDGIRDIRRNVSDLVIILQNAPKFNLQVNNIFSVFFGSRVFYFVLKNHIFGSSVESRFNNVNNQQCCTLDNPRVGIHQDINHSRGRSIRRNKIRGNRVPGPRISRIFHETVIAPHKTPLKTLWSLSETAKSL